MNTIQTITMALALTSSSLVFAGSDSSSIYSLIGNNPVSKPTAKSGKSAGSLVTIVTPKEIETIIKEIETITIIKTPAPTPETTFQIKWVDSDGGCYGGNPEDMQCYSGRYKWTAVNLGYSSAVICSDSLSYCFDNSDADKDLYLGAGIYTRQKVGTGTALEKCRRFNSFQVSFSLYDGCPF